MVITKLNRSFSELKVKYDRGETDTHEYKKKIKEYKKNIDQWLNFNKKEFKEIGKVFSGYNSKKAMINDLFGRNQKTMIINGESRSILSSYVGQEIEDGIEYLFEEFKKTKNINKAIKHVLLNFDELELEKIKNIFKGIKKLFNLISFSEEDMKEAIEFIFKLIESDEEESSGKIEEFVVKEDDKCFDYLREKYGEKTVHDELFGKLTNDRPDAEFQVKAGSSLLRKQLEIFAEFNGSGKQSYMVTVDKNTLSKKLCDDAKSVKGRLRFQKNLNSLFVLYGVNSKANLSNKLTQIFNKMKAKRQECKNGYKEVIDDAVREFVKKQEASKIKRPSPPEYLRNKRSSRMNDRPLPPTPQQGEGRVRQKSESSLPSSTPQKNSIDENNKASQRKSVERLSLEQMKTLEESLNNKSKPFSKPSSEQRKDAIYSSEDESKNPNTSNDKSVKPRKSKKRLSKLFGIKRKEDNKSNKSWRKSLKNRLSKSFGKSSKPSNDTFTSSSNSTDEISTES